MLESKMHLEFYQSIVATLPVGIVVLQWEKRAEVGRFRLVFANEASELLFGIPHSLLIDRTLTEALPTSLATSLYTSCHAVLSTTEARDLGDIAYKGKNVDGFFRIQILPLPDQCVLVVLTNVTEQKRIEEERKQTELALKIYNRKLEASNRELEEFAYVASHDLQEPLRKIMAFGDRLRRKYGAVLDEVGQDYLARMQNAAGRLQNLISDLLELSRVATRRQPFEQVDLTTLVTEVLKDLETVIEQQRGRVDVAPLPTITADPVQIRQLFQNLIGNALKFHKPDNRPIVKISSQVEPVGASSNVIYSIMVADNGIGFEEKYVDRIFQPFQRLHSSTLYTGTGMGLAICRRIVERHGGTITAKSQPDMGATFFITLPAVQPIAEAVASAPSSGVISS
jgi:signal transduction histidine kinase